MIGSPFLMILIILIIFPIAGAIAIKAKYSK